MLSWSPVSEINWSRLHMDKEVRKCSQEQRVSVSPTMLILWNILVYQNKV